MRVKTKVMCGSTSAIAATIAVLGACADNDDAKAERSDVRGGVTVIDQAQQQAQIADVRWINGTYEGCAGRTDGQEWSVLADGVESPPSQDPEFADFFALLTVQRGDSSCELSLTGVVTDDGVYNTAPTAIALTPSATLEFDEGDAEVNFYGRARFTSIADYSDDFGITLTLAENPNFSEGGGEVVVSPVVVTADLTVEQVRAPNYTLETALSGQDDVTEETEIRLVLPDEGDVPATQYLITTTLDDTPTYAEVNEAFVNALDTDDIEEEGALEIAVGALIPDGEELDPDEPLNVSIILANVDAGAGDLRSYQVISFALTAPAAPAAPDALLGCPADSTPDDGGRDNSGSGGTCTCTDVNEQYNPVTNVCELPDALLGCPADSTPDDGGWDNRATGGTCNCTEGNEQYNPVTNLCESEA